VTAQSDEQKGGGPAEINSDSGPPAPSPRQLNALEYYGSIEDAIIEGLRLAAKRRDLKSKPSDD